MTDKQFRAFLDLMMCSDPWPVTDTGTGDGQDLLLEFASSESRDRGFTDWVTAYHQWKPS